MRGSGSQTDCATDSWHLCQPENTGAANWEGQLRDRVLTLSVMSAIVVSLVYRQGRYLSEIVRVLEQEGLLWLSAQQVSRQAVSKRLVE
ncbi:hypothetical protein AB3R30_26795 [Leptolyngbyaceae cyanobacterium UHCC 1019]